MDPVEANAAFARKYRFPYPLLSDTDGQVCRAYSSCSETGETMRNTIIVGPDGKIRQIFKNVKREGHIETVIAFLESEATAVTSTRDQRPQINLVEGEDPSREGVQEKMDDQQGIENSTVSEPAALNRPEGPPEGLAGSEAEVVTPTAPAPSGIAAATKTSLPAVLPSQVQPAQPDGSGPSLVFALGTLGYDFGTEARRDSLAQHMANPAPNPQDSAQLLAYLEANPDQAAAVIWTLSLDATPIYAVSPNGPFAAAAYERLRQFLDEQLTEGVERVSIAGVIIGKVRLMSGQTIPVIWPELRCMYSWTTAALVEVIAGEPSADNDNGEEREGYAEKVAAVLNFLERVYYELRNLGVTPQDRALNYAATNALIVAGIFEEALKAGMELDTIEVERSPICRPDSECWDVVLCFFDPESVLHSRKCYRFTVDVSDVCPVMVGKVRSWSVR
jgi:cyanobactin maturation PatA/PatG family protease